MSDNLAPARAREAAESWLEGRRASAPTPPRVSGAWADQAMADAFATGFEMAEAYCAVVHRAEQDQWAVERATGQQQLDDATALMTETAELLRGYEKHHRDQATFADPGSDQRRDHHAKAERNALAAMRLDAWLRGEDRYPVTVAEAEASRPLTHRDLAAGCGALFPEDNEFSEIVASLVRGYAGADATSVSIAQRIHAYYRAHPAEPLSGETDDEIASDRARFPEVPPPRSVPNSVKATHLPPMGTDPVMKADHSDLGADMFPEGRCEPAGRAPWRVEGVADLTVLRLQTCDPLFNPLAPVCINGYLYHPTTETR